MKKQIRKKKTGGYAALLAVVIISFMAFTAVSSSSLEGIKSFFGVLDRENKEIGFNLALSCFDQAVLRVVQNPNWQPSSTSEELFLDGGTCLIKEISFLDNQNFKVMTEAKVGKTHTSLTGVFDLLNFEIISLKEI